MNVTRYTAIFVIAICCGCGEKSAPPAPSKSSNAKPPAVTKPQPDAATEQLISQPTTPVVTNDFEDPPVIGKPQEAFNFPRRPLELPPVLLTEAETKNSLIKVGDKFPELMLPDLNGKPQQLAKLLGPKLTAVVFWNTTNPYAVEQIGDMGPVIGERFGSHGVEIVGIVEGPAAAAKAAIKKAGVTFVNLVDTDGKALKRVATAELPRTYLLDKDGNVLWFDLEYSRSTRRDLVRGIQFALLNQK